MYMFSVVIGVGGVSYAAVPLYKAFCQATGQSSVACAVISLARAVADLVLSEVYTLAQHICCFRRVVEHNWVSRDNLYCRIKRVQHHFHALQQYLDAVIACQLTAKVSVRLVPTDRWQKPHLKPLLSSVVVQVLEAPLRLHQERRLRE
jgi:hypothetical protein